MATDWAADVKKYVANADDAAIAGIVKYCGIALRNRDSALVSFSDKAETDRVRTNFLKKKLGLAQADSVLDAAIAKVAAQMKADRTKNRVTVYYLLASEFKQLGLFSKAAPAAKKAPISKAPAKAVPAKAAPAKAAPAKAAAKPAAATTKPATKTKAADKAVGMAAVVTGAAAKAKPAKASPATAKSSATAAPRKKVSAAPKKAAVAAPSKTAAPAKKAASSAKATTAKAAAPGSNATQGMLDKAASTASDTGKAAPKAPAAVAAATLAAAGATAGATEKPTTAISGGSKPAVSSSGPASTSAASPVDDGSEMGWLWWVIGLAVLAFLAWFLFARGPDAPDINAAEAAASAAASDVGTDLAAAPAEGSVTIPAGAGVTSEMRDGKPVVKVYFDTAKTDVTPDFAKTAAGLKEWLDTHSGSVVAISGYNDPSGNAAANAELSKQRAQAVQAGLVRAGIPAAAAMLVKPEVTADASVAAEAARRVEVVVK